MIKVKPGKDFQDGMVLSFDAAGTEVEGRAGNVTITGESKPVEVNERHAAVKAAIKAGHLVEVREAAKATAEK